ncbi:Uncharacterised protein [Xylophilus ampelinus]|nr:Uncharacterised protein [Xylophilus ampelinus]
MIVGFPYFGTRAPLGFRQEDPETQTLALTFTGAGQVVDFSQAAQRPRLWQQQVAIYKPRQLEVGKVRTIRTIGMDAAAEKPKTLGVGRVHLCETCRSPEA